MDSLSRPPEKTAGSGRVRSGTAAKAKPLSHNLNGQRLGRKGRDTRDRILAATNALLAGPADVQISLSAVAREASLGMSSLYLYFGDLTQLLLAVFEPIMATAETAYVSQLRSRWADDELGVRAFEFVAAYHAFWVRHSRLLHLRNHMADRMDEGMLQHRMQTVRPIMRLLVEQMDGDLDSPQSPVFSMATALTIGLERVVTVTTDVTLQTLLHTRFSSSHAELLQVEARLLELGIADFRARSRA